MAVGRRQATKKKDSQAGKPKKRRLSRKARRLLVTRLLLLSVVMLALFLLTFSLSALLTGNANRISRLAGSIFSPGTPKLVIRDADHEFRVSPLSQKHVQEFNQFLSVKYEDNPGIVALNTEGSAVADLRNQTPFQRQLIKTGYTPQTLTVKQYFSQKVSFSPAPTAMEAHLFFQDDYFSSQSLDDVNLFAPDRDGFCYVLVDALWEAERSWQKPRSGMYCFAIMFDRPTVFTLNTEDVDPGELLVFYAEHLMPGEPVTVQSGLFASLQFSPYGQRQMIALAPVSYDLKPGSYSTTLTAGNVSKTFDITVKDKEFAVQYLSIDPQIVAETRTDETVKDFQDKVNPILAEQLPELLWQGKAALPVPEGKVLTLFGSRRYINDEVNPYRHSGLDLQAPIGTEVKAVNRGKVLFAEYLAYTGNTILIEHGLGLKSWYYHLDEILVAPGDSVEREEVIGLSGATGFAAEPHLHLNLSVGGVHINPVTAINQSLFNDQLP